MRDTLLEALPVFVGALLDLYFLNASFPGVVVALVLAHFIVSGLMAYTTAAASLASHPKFAVRVWQLQMLAPMACIAGVGYLGGWALAELPNILPLIPFLDLPGSDAAGNTGEAPDYTDIASPLATAGTSFLGVVFLDDLRKGEGGLWPRAQIKAGFKAKFGPGVTVLKNGFERRETETQDEHRARLAVQLRDIADYELLKRAVFEDEISDAHPVGWSFAAAHARADIVARLLLAKSG